MCSSFFLLLRMTKNLGQNACSSCLKTLNSNAWEEKQDCKSNTLAASTQLVLTATAQTPAAHRKTPPEEKV